MGKEFPDFRAETTDDDDDKESLGDLLVKPKAPEHRDERKTEKQEVDRHKAAEVALKAATHEAEPVHEDSGKETGELGATDKPEAMRMVVDVIDAADPNPDAIGSAYRGLVRETGEAEAPYEQIKEELEEGLSPEDLADVAGDIPEKNAAANGPENEAEFDPDGDGIIFDNTAESAPDSTAEAADEDDPAATSGPGGTGTPLPPPIPHHGPGGGGTSNTPPPHGPFGPTPPFGPHFGGPGGGFNPNVAAMPVPNPNVAPANPMEHIDDGGNAAGAALLGGIVGYFIGRRRGRIKAEKQAKKVEKRLTKQIEHMHWDLKDKEARLRRLAAKQVERNGPAVIERLAAMPVAVRAAHAAEREPAVLRQQAPEAHHLHGSSKSSEQIGHMLMAAEATTLVAGRLASEAGPARRAEISPAERTQLVPRVEAIKLSPEKHVETMNRAELLAFSERIIVDGSSLRQIYETHLVGEHGLRRLVAEHLRGGDLKKALRNEVVEREIDFERDPAMRDVASGGAGPIATGGGTAVLDQLVEKAAARVDANPTEQVAFYKARTQYEVAQHEKEQQQRRIVDIALTTVITILTALVVIMYLSHR